jgi:hypothetical protein
MSDPYLLFKKELESLFIHCLPGTRPPTCSYCNSCPPICASNCFKQCVKKGNPKFYQCEYGNFPLKYEKVFLNFMVWMKQKYKLWFKMEITDELKEEFTDKLKDLSKHIV